MIDEKLVEQAEALRQAGDKLALAAAQVICHHDGIHRLAGALANWYDLRAGVHGITGSEVPSEATPTPKPPAKEDV